MKKKDLLFTSLLVISLIFNLFIWEEVKDIRNNQFNDYTPSYSSEFSSINAAIAELSREKKWLQQSNFTLDKGNSSLEIMFLQGEWHLGELESNQTPVLLLREKEQPDWLEIPLEKKELLTYAGKLELIPNKRYEYKLVTKGKVNRSSDILVVPYELYGFPSWEIGWEFIEANNRITNYQFNLNFTHEAPIEAMKPTSATLNLLKNGKVIQRLPFEEVKNFDPMAYPNAAFLTSIEHDKLFSLEISEANIEIEYANGLKVNEPFHRLNEEIDFLTGKY